MFSIVFSNRYECLQAMLLERLAAERPGPFGKRHVVVPSSALRRDVELAVADREGVCANVEFSYLAQWLWTQIGRVVEVPARSPFVPALLAWRVHALIDPAAPAADWVTAHPRLAHYLAGADARMRFELAERIARVFDHYLTYRPHWLESWARGERARLGEATEAERADEAWQAALWRHIRDGLALRQEHPAALFLRRVAGMDERALAAAGLPQTVHVFGLPALPPLYLAILRELARVVDVRLYALNPCQEYWFDIVDRRRLSWLAARQADMFFETGNRLLAAWGQQTQAHIGLLFEGENEVVDDAVFEPHPGRHLLARLHNAILDMQELEPGSVALAANDRSIELHVCHSRTRELEVLHDRLLDLMKGAAKRGEPLRPDEIVVLTPDLDATAPLIEAVFGTAPAARRIPWRITGLGGTRENPVAAALDRLLALVAGRLPASAVFDLLQQPVVAARFGLGESDLEMIHGWMRAAGIRWGLDGEHVAAAGGVPAEACGAHTLDAGLDRLFLGWAAGDAATAAPFAGLIGAGAAEGNAALALGRLWRYVETLRTLRTDLQRPQDAAGWRRALEAVLARLVGDEPEWAEALREVREAIVALTQAMAAAASDDGEPPAIPLAVVHPALIAQLDDPARGGVPGGTVTFSALSSLRGLPYRVVCVVGLDQGLFPGSDRPAEFDLMAVTPERGDRQRRHDDRNLFLDVLLSAREVLHLSHVGRSVRDGSALPPSVLVDELFDVLAAACATDPRKPDDLAAARRRLTVEHPLQAFSAEYFLPQAERDPRLVSYHEEYAAALAARIGAPLRDADDDAPVAIAEEGDEGPADGARVPFFETPLPPPGPEWREVGLPQLIRFFRNPSRYLLRDRLGLALPEGEAELEDVEPMVPDFPGRQALAERLLPVLLGATVPDDDALHALARAGGEYPAGALGEGALRRELAQLTVFAAAVRAELPARPLPPHVPTLAFELDGERWTLGAAFGDLRPQGLLRQRYDDCRPVDYLGAWLAHLVLCAAPAPDVACETTLLARDGRCRFTAVAPATAHALLADCLRLYRDGLLRPLHFFPKAAWAYAVNGESMGKAYARWQGGNRPAFAERADPAYRLALRGVADPLADDFATIASQVLGPLLDHLDDPRLDLAPAQERA